ncbi:MAG TPA: DUF1269 domain-containing protein [Luteimonas sp.]|nr:DUF1269 domain-containing protein [Luteimonas sp.]HRP71169.1 DUF1269 domain-containing protein [Luteimonas sp.]
MADLIVVGFKDENTADKALNMLSGAQKAYLIDVADSCVVVRDDKGELRLKQAVNLVKTGAASGGAWGALWGTLVGVLFLNPLAGLLTGSVFGAGMGAISGKLSDYGIDDEFIRSVGEVVQPGTSALFVLVNKANPDKLYPELAQLDGTVIKTSLSNEQEQRLREALQGVQAQAAA